MFKKYHLYSFLLISLWGLSSCSNKFVKLQKNGTEAQKYDAALNYFAKKDYYRAGLLFDEIIPIMKGDTATERAQMLNAYCQFYEKQYQLAGYKFKTFYEVYNRSPFAEEAFYMYAYSLYKDSPIFNLDQTSTLTAIESMQTFINEYPTSKYVEQATGLIAEMRKKLEQKAYEKAKLYYQTSGVSIANYKAAVIAINNFIKDFPDSDYIEELLFLKIKSEYDLAKVSFESKQQERFKEAMTFYEEFIDKYPKSKYLKDAEKLYEGSQKGLEEAIKLEKEAKAAAAAANN
jgi:outer membrane protein assembly factor BamD